MNLNLKTSAINSTKLFIALLFSSLIALQSCDKVTDDDPDKLNLADFLSGNKPLLQTKHVTAGQVKSITGANGCVITFDTNSFSTLAGAAITSGTIDIELREILSKKDMILSQTPTVSDDRLIVSQGVYYIKALKGGAQLRISNFKITKPATSLPNNMRAFLGYTDANTGFNWTLVADSSGNVVSDSLGYELSLVSTYFGQNYNWINCDYFYDTTATKVEVYFTTDDNISVYNFQSYIVFNDLNAVLRYGSYADKKITFSNIPAGLNATVLTYYIVDGKVFAATANITTSDTLTTPITFTETNEHGLLNILGGL